VAYFKKPFRVQKPEGANPYGWQHQQIAKRLCDEAHGTPCPRCHWIMDATLPRGSSTKPVADHVLPVVAGGAAVARELKEDAYAVMCHSCNSSKGGRVELPVGKRPYWETHDHYVDALCDPNADPPGDW